MYFWAASFTSEVVSICFPEVVKLKNVNNVEKTKTLIVVWGFVIVNVVDGPLSLSLCTKAL